jgi:hypothetical protein
MQAVTLRVRIIRAVDFNTEMIVVFVTVRADFHFKVRSGGVPIVPTTGLYELESLAALKFRRDAHVVVFSQSFVNKSSELL